MKNYLMAIAIAWSLLACKSTHEDRTIGSVERMDPALDQIIESSATPEILSDGYEWSEGPLWVESEKMLLFSDVPTNIVYKWTEQDSIEVYLKPSGYTGTTPSTSPEQGSNGLALSRDGKLVLCQHGDRRLAFMEAPLNAPGSSYSSVADRFDGKKFNSPNDVVVSKGGDYFFTDPPYGMPRDLTQEIPFQGVYKVSNGEVTLLVDSLTRPNGIAFMPGEKTVVIANSDPKRAMWYVYDLDDSGAFTNGRIFNDATAGAAKEPGLPDGLKIDGNGNVFATGPGGIWIFNKEGKLLGKIKMPVPTSNCAFADNEKTLFITADNFVVRLKMRQ